MAKEVITLGINDGHNAGAALVRSGDVVAAIQEERLVNEKNYSGVPRHAIQEVFRISGIPPADVDVVSIVSLNRVYAPLKELPWKVRFFEWISPYVASHWWSRFYVRILSRRRRTDELRRVLQEFGLLDKELMFVEHHAAHAATAFYPRPWNEPTLVLTADGAGDGLSSTVGVGDGSDIERVASSTYYDSVGNSFYSEITAYLGMKRWEHEYKCVAGETPVLLGTGETRPIEDLFAQASARNPPPDGQDEATFTCSIPVIALDRKRQVLVPALASKVYRKRVRGTLFEVETSSGRRVRVTPNHRFQVLDGGVLQEIEAERLQQGTAIGIPRDLRLPGEPVPTEEDWGSFFGLFLSEGWEDFRPEKSTDQFYFSNNSQQLHGLFRETCEGLFGKRPSSSKPGRTRLSSVGLLSERSRLLSTGYSRALAGAKRVPRAILRMGPTGTSAFLRGYFEGDGGVVLNRDGGHFVAATTKSPGMASDLSYLLLRHGIVARLGRYETYATNAKRPKRSAYWRVKISGSDAMSRYAREIGFIRAYNRRRLEQASAYEPRTKTDTIPCAALVRELYHDGKIPLGLYLTYYHDCRRSGRISRPKLNRFLNEVTVRDPRIERLRTLAAGDIQWDRVQQVREVAFEGWVYDLYVPGFHTFVGGFGGLVLHNTMGLAPYGKADYCLDAMRSLIRINPQRPLEFQNTSGACGTRVQKVLRRELAGERFDNVAAACQQHFEDLMVQWVRNAIAATDLHKVACAGGLFLNVKANKRLRELPEVEDIFFYPACDDGGTPVGAALEAYYRFCERDGRKPERNPLGQIYYGSSYSDPEIESALVRAGYDHEANRQDDIDGIVGELVADGKIVARFAGGTEWGPRALGNRTILADPRDLRVVKRLNSAIKQRDFWMPFAPSILEGRMADYLVGARPARYMIEAFDTTDEGRDLAAALHPQDGTARPQTVNAWNPGYREIIESFQTVTGVGGILNTSFNLHGYPIVGTPDLALWTFQNSALDALAIGGYLITK